MKGTEKLAKRRSFSERVLGSDAYADLSDKQQLVYIALSMAADDEGMVGAPRRIARSIGGDERALDALARAGYVIRFPSGVCAVTHFHVNNYIPEDRRKATEYPAERALLTLTDTGEYALCDTLHAICMQNTSDTPAPLSSPPSPPSSFSPCTPLSITPYNPPHHTPHPLSSSSNLSARARGGVNALRDGPRLPRAG